MGIGAEMDDAVGSLARHFSLGHVSWSYGQIGIIGQIEVGTSCLIIGCFQRDSI